MYINTYKSYPLPCLISKNDFKILSLFKFVFRAYSDIYTSLNEDESQLNE